MGDLVFGDTVPPVSDEVATGPEFFRPDMFLGATTSAGAAGPLHSLVDSPGIETNVVSVCRSNISTLVRSAHTFAELTASSMLTIVRTSFDGRDATTEVELPRLQFDHHRVADQGTVSAKETYLHLAWGKMGTIRGCKYIGDDGAHTLIFGEGHSCEADAVGQVRRPQITSLAG